MKKNKETPQLREGWLKVRIGDLAHFINGKTFHSSEWKTNGIPIIRIQNLNNKDSSFNYISNETEIPYQYHIETGDLLFAWSGTPGTSFGAHIWKGPKAYLNQHIYKVVPFAGVNKLFFYYTLNQLVNQFVQKSKGTAGLSHITKAELENTECFLPPIELQIKIVDRIEELLSELDKSIEDLEKVNKQLVVYRQLLLKNAFEGKLTESWRKENDFEATQLLYESIQKERKNRYRKEFVEWENNLNEWKKNNKKGKRPLKPKEITEGEFVFEKEDNLPEIPKEWMWVKNKLLAYKITDGEHVTPDRTDYGYYLLSARNIQNGYLDLKNVDYVSQEEYNRIRKRCDPEFGDILISCSGSIGRVCHVPVNSDFVMVRSVALMKYQFNDLNYKFLEYLFRSPYLQFQIGQRQKATAQANLFLGPIGELNLVLCSKKEQDRIVDILETQFSICENLENTITTSLTKAQKLKKSILKKGFDGKLVEQNTSSTQKQLKQLKLEKTLYFENLSNNKVTPKKVMRKELLTILTEKFGNKNFTFENMRNEINIPYDELKKQLFALLEKETQLTSSFDEKKEQIVFTIPR